MKMKFSEFVRTALNDLKDIETDPRYTVNMEVWHSFDESDNVCHVCLAGAMMASRLCASPKEELLPSNFPDVAEKLRALDAFQIGYIREAYNRFTQTDDPRPELSSAAEDLLQRYDTGEITTPCYRTNRKKFFQHFYALADALEKAGL